MIPCPTCNQLMRPGSRMCPSCGTWLLDDSSAAPQTLPPSATPFGMPPGAVPTAAPATISGATRLSPPAHPTMPPVAPTMPPVAPQPAAQAPVWAPPNPSQRVEQVPPVVGPPSVNAELFFGPSDEVEEHTILSSRRTTQPAVFWSISLPNGAVELVTDRPIVVGREPQFMQALPQARLIPVPDPTRSMSKNHACFSLYGGSLVVEDLGSTNGIVVIRADGREHDLGVGGRAELEVGARVELGDVVIRVGRA